jgi:hypothetical protein
MPWDRTRIAAEIRKAATLARLDSLRLRHITDAAASSDPQEVLEGAALVFQGPSEGPSSLLEQEYAGRVLLAVRPPCADPERAAQQVFPYWNVSVEQVPQYFASVLEPETMEKLVAFVAERSPDLAKSIRFWLRALHGNGDSEAPPN